MADHDKERTYWLDDPANVKKVVWALVGVCVIVFLADALIHKHGYFQVEHIFGFYGIYGFVVCVGLVLAAKALRIILMRPEDYYDSDD
ncbi:MAG: hypothetical protein QNJ30_01010 [Kiloniellales bacterium]|nr:hypothetical protein [Kiloniellales bacterium]